MVNVNKVREILIEMGKVIEKNKNYLTELDKIIGDGDHGFNMSNGFKAVAENLKDDDCTNIGKLFQKTGIALIANVGGVSGALYGTAFIKAAEVINGKTEIDINDFVKVLEVSIDGIKMRGKVELEKKTMLDAIIPAYEAAKLAIVEGKDYREVLLLAKNAAFKGVEHTKEIQATKGKASYLGESSIGHQDAGATSCALMIEAVYNCLK